MNNEKHGILTEPIRDPAGKSCCISCKTPLLELADGVLFCPDCAMLHASDPHLEGLVYHVTNIELRKGKRPHARFVWHPASTSNTCNDCKRLGLLK